MISAVPREMPTAIRPSQMKRPRPSAQMKAVTPGSMLGGRRCTERMLLTEGLTLRGEGRPTARDQKNSPSRFRFRPPLPLTFPLRVLPSDLASTYSRSVLGASTKLRDARHACKWSGSAMAAICVKFNFQHFHSNSCSLWKTLWKGQRRANTRHAGAAIGSVTRSTIRTRNAMTARAMRTTNTAAINPTPAPASTSPG